MIFEGLGAGWMFIGAVPVAAWERVRATTDADFAVTLNFSEAVSLDRGMGGGGFQKESGPVEIPGKRLVLSKYWAPHADGGLGIDVFFTTGYDTGRFLAAALLRKVAVTFYGESYWSAGPEDLLIFKILALRTKDLDDVASVLERRFDRLEWGYLQARATELHVDGLLTQVVREFMAVSGCTGFLPWERPS